MLLYTREQIYSALLTLLGQSVYIGGPSKGQKVFASTSITRIRRTLDQILPEMQPYLIMAQPVEEPLRHSKLPAIWHFRVQLYVLFQADQLLDPASPSDPEQPPVTFANHINDAIERVLDPLPAQHSQTLSSVNPLVKNTPMVTHCRIEGAVQIDDGAEDQQGLITIPIDILPTL